MSDLSDDAVDILLSLSQDQEERLERRVEVSCKSDLDRWRAVHPNFLFVAATDKLLPKLRREENKPRRDKQSMGRSQGQLDEVSPFANNENTPFPEVGPIHSKSADTVKPYFRSYNVASYDAPSWRVIISRSSGCYIERSHPKELNRLHRLRPGERGFCSTALGRELGQLDPNCVFDLTLSALYYQRETLNNDVILERCKNLDKLAVVEDRLVDTDPDKLIVFASEWKSPVSSELKDNSVVDRSKRSMTDIRFKSKAAKKKMKPYREKQMKLARPHKNAQCGSFCFLPPIAGACLRNPEFCENVEYQQAEIIHMEDVQPRPAVNQAAKVNYLKPLYLPTLNDGNCDKLASKSRRVKLSCAHARASPLKDFALPSIYGVCVALSVCNSKTDLRL